MVQRERIKTFVLTVAITLCVIGFFFGFSVTHSRTEGSGQQGLLSVLGGLVYFGIAFSVVLVIYKILQWAANGFYVDEAGEAIGEDEGINLKAGCRRVMIILAGVVAIYCGCLLTSLPITERRKAQNDLKILQKQVKDFNGKAYYEYAQRLRVEDNFWLDLDKGRFGGLCVLVFLGGAVGGFCSVWLGYRFFEQLVINCLGRQEQ